MVEVEGDRGDMTVCKSSKNTNPERGASLVEYALLVALLCVVAVGGVRAVGVSVEDTMVKAERHIGSGGFTDAGETD